MLMYDAYMMSQLMATMGPMRPKKIDSHLSSIFMQVDATPKTWLKIVQVIVGSGYTLLPLEASWVVSHIIMILLTWASSA